MKRLLWGLAALTLAAITFAQSTGGGFFPSQTGITFFEMPPNTFATLGTPANGSFAFCSDCAATTPCAGSGTGAFAFRVGGTWDCSGGSGFPLKAPAEGDFSAPSYGFYNSNAGMLHNGGYLFLYPGDGSGTNAAGEHIQISSGKGTGSGAGGTIALAIATASTSGSSLNTLQNVVLIDGTNGSVLIGGINALSPTTSSFVGTRAIATDIAGGGVTITGGAATVGNASGGNVTLDGGAGVGTGIKGFVTLGARTFTTLGTPSNGSIAYCSDCAIANPCAGSGTGAIAKRLNGAWVCN